MQKFELFIIFPFITTSRSIYDQNIYHYLRKIVEYSYSDSITKNELIYFAETIGDFLKLYRTTIKKINKEYSDKKEHLKATFKIHFLYHYPEAIQKFGPLKL